MMASEDRTNDAQIQGDEHAQCSLIHAPPLPPTTKEKERANLRFSSTTLRVTRTAVSVVI